MQEAIGRLFAVLLGFAESFAILETFEELVIASKVPFLTAIIRRVH
jgi:hypothetical protein